MNEHVATLRVEPSNPKLRLSLRLSLGTAFVIMIVLTAFVLGFASFLSVRSQIRLNLAQRLMDLAGAAVVGVDSGEHAKLQKPGDMEGATYKSLRARLQ